MPNLHYIPVIIDGDTERETMSKYHVSGFPTVKFADATGKVVGEIGSDRSARNVIARAKQAFETIQPVFTKAYAKAVKTLGKLDIALAKKDYARALKIIAKVEGWKEKGSTYDRVVAEKAKLREIARADVARAQAMPEIQKPKAKALLKRVARDFKGLPEAEDAQKALEAL